MEDQGLKRELLTIFFAQKHIIYAVATLIFAASVMVALFWPSTYSATGSILVKGKQVQKSPSALERQFIQARKITKEDLSAEVRILLSPAVIGASITKLRKQNKFAAGPASGSFLGLFGGTDEKEGELSPLQKDIYRMTKHITTKVLPASHMIEVVYIDRDPAQAVLILDTIMEQYIAHRMSVYNSGTSLVFLTAQTQKFKADMLKKEDELMSVARQGMSSDPDDERRSNLLLRKNISMELNTLMSDVAEKEQYIEFLEKILDKKGIQFFSFIKDIQINKVGNLSSSLQKLVVKRNKLLKVYSLQSPPVTALNKQIDGMYAAMRKEVLDYRDSNTNQLNIAKSKIVSFKKRISEIDARNIQLKEQGLHLKRVENDLNLLQNSYKTFFQRTEEARINSTGGSNSFFISIIQKAFPSNGPAYPKPGIVILLGLVAGSITGLGIGFLREYSDRTFKRPSDVYNQTGLPVIFSIPLFNGGNHSGPIPVKKHPPQQQKMA